MNITALLILIAILGKVTEIAGDCMRFLNISYKDEVQFTDAWTPPLLISYPGQGASHLRSLIEFATGYHSGSIIGGNKWAGSNKFVAERKCGYRLSIVNCDKPYLIHVDWWGNVRMNYRQDRTRCRNGAIFNGFKHVMLLVSSPIESIVYTYNQHHNLSSNQVVNEKRILDIAKQYFNEWEKIIVPLIVHLGGFGSRLDIVRYEDLLDKSKRLDSLSGVVTFLSRTIPSRERLECAFEFTKQSNEYDMIQRHVQMLVTKQPLIVEKLWSLSQYYANNFSYSYPAVLQSIKSRGYGTDHSKAMTNLLTILNSSATTIMTQKDKHGKSLTSWQNNSMSFVATLSCISTLGHRAFRPYTAIDSSMIDYQNVPPLLLSYPGSGKNCILLCRICHLNIVLRKGNTWTRLLLEYVTGYFTGSIYVVSFIQLRIFIL
jgi:hypothetical protein